MKNIRLFATLRDIAGTSTLNVPFQGRGSVRDLVRAINQACPEVGGQLLDEQGQLSNAIHIYVRGRNVEWLQGLDTVVDEEDNVLLVPPMAGG